MKFGLSLINILLLSKFVRIYLKDDLVMLHDLSIEYSAEKCTSDAYKQQGKCDDRRTPLYRRQSKASVRSSINDDERSSLFHDAYKQ